VPDVPTPGGVSVVKHGRVATVSWARPAKKNAFDTPVALAVAGALDELSVDDELSVVVLRPGGPVFCAGWDLGEIVSARESGVAGVEAIIAAGRRCLDAIDNVPGMVVVVVEGRVLGFGVSILAHGDFVIMTDDSLIALPEMRHGIVPAAVLGDIAPIVGDSRSMNWALSGSVPRDEALSTGLVSKVVATAALETTLESHLEQLSAMNSSAVRATKRLLNATTAGDRRQSQQRGDAAAVAAVMDSGNGK
jgi:enoyl-CoA hydratase/carnithine racemase